MMNETLEWKLTHLPESPGCYLMKSQGEIIYVGKAKNLKNRVRQYFQSTRAHTPKVLAMVARIDDFETVLVDGELEALILECNLIKLHRPFYNILLRDDKHYPYIAIDPEEMFPRVQLRRRQEKDGCRYFGPYASATVVREVLDVVRMVFPIRVCDKKLTEDMHMRPCVHHATGQCLAPCAGKVSQAEYREVVSHVLEFLSGKYEPVLRNLKARMQEASAQFLYERAAVYRDRMRAIENIAQKQKAILTSQGDQDVLATMPEDVDALVVRLSIREGKLISAHTSVLPRSGDETPGDVLTSFILQHYDENLLPREILLSDPIEEADTLAELLRQELGRKVILHVPVRGDKKKLVEMAKKNLRDEAEKRRERLSRTYARTKGALAELQTALGLDAPPRRIEGYDISNTQGALSVGAMVVMIDGVLAKKEYRHFRIKTVEGANDFASIREVLSRRLRHGMQECRERAEKGLPPIGGRFSDMPDLILIDGGKGQLHEALDAMREAGAAIPMFGLAKRLDEIVLPEQADSLLLDRHSEALHLIERLRDEAHRFGITHHRALRAKKFVESALDDIPGIGEKKRRALIAQFGSVEKIRAADVRALAQAQGIGPKLAETLFHALHQNTPADSQ